MNDAAKMRNAIVHGNWGMENGVVARSNVTARGELKMKHNNPSIADLEKTSEAIVAACKALVELVTAGNPARDTPQSGQ